MNHEQKVALLQKALDQRSSKIAFFDSRNPSNTTRSKSYSHHAKRIDVSHLNEILNIDEKSQTAIAEPRVTMRELVRATLKKGLIPAVVPEFKGITVGGAIMGAAAESSSHRRGIFSDCCTHYHLLCGDGKRYQLSQNKNSQLFYALPGSYGSLGLLTQAEIELVPAKPTVSLRYTRLTPVELVKAAATSTSFFVDGLIFSDSLALLIEGSFSDKRVTSPPRAFWYADHCYKLALRYQEYEESMPIFDYLFRYDQGAFWMGGYLFYPRLLAKFFLEGICQFPHEVFFRQKDLNRFTPLVFPSSFSQAVFSPFMSSRFLWKLLHKAEKWVQDRFVIQDACIPEENALLFLQEIFKEPAIFPLWVCPIKATTTPQIFAPHFQSEEKKIVNFGLYGLAPTASSLERITRKMERSIFHHSGRKVLYSRTCYTLEEFWEIYPKKIYDLLREKTHSTSVWPDITEKVLSL